jgi:hypothetical protein
MKNLRVKTFGSKYQQPALSMKTSSGRKAQTRDHEASVMPSRWGQRVVDFSF